MNIIAEIQSPEKKSKERTLKLVAAVRRDPALFQALLGGLELPKAPERGMCAEIMAAVTKEKPEIFPAEGIDEVIRHLGDKAPGVKRETAQIIGNLAAVFPDKAGLAVPALLLNADDEGTVIRWSAAYGLTRIAEANVKLRPGLVKKIESIVKSETNNGVKNIYLKSMKKLLKN